MIEETGSKELLLDFLFIVLSLKKISSQKHLHWFTRSSINKDILQVRERRDNYWFINLYL